MTRYCPVCGVEEQRTVDSKGRPVVNLEPITGKCLDCLIQGVNARVMREPSVTGVESQSRTQDVKQLQTGEQE